MAEQLQQLAQAPEFDLTDVNGNRVVLSEFCGRQPVVLVMTRGFI